jgi:hypothetical protein
MRTLGASAAVGFLLCGCTNVPSIGVFGAFFPDWMFCIVGAIVVTTIIHQVLAATGWLERAGKISIAFSYLALTALLAFSAWLLLFQN